MDLKQRKEQIELLFSQGEIEEAKKLLDEYEVQYPEDIDVISLKLNYCLIVGDLESAKTLAQQGVRRLPLNGDMVYNLAYVYELLGDEYLAYINYERAKVIYAYTGNTMLQDLKIDEKTDSILQKFLDETKSITNRSELEKKRELINMLAGLEKNRFGLMEKSFRSCAQIIGDYYYENEAERRFVGVFKDQFFNLFAPAGNMDVIHLKGEFLKVVEGTHILLNDTNLGAEEEYLLPIAGSENNIVHHFTDNKNSYDVVQYWANHFNYYRVHNNTNVTSTGKSYYGKPILLKKDPTKKRIVLSIFVDGLSQHILKGEDFRRNMPHTYNYFKKGTICNRAYNTAEWTYPSIVNYVTGLNTVQHMLFHNELDCNMPLDVPTLAEYFHNQGYYTAKFCGNWRIIPSYGHARGYDRFVYQNQAAGFKVHEVISDAINHIEAFKEVNQYLWISIGDLHDIADGLDLPTAVQKELPLQLRTIEEKGATSAKQSYSKNKTENYIRQARYVDYWLHILYSYLEENFTEDEVIVSLFSDHGQGYLIERDAHFLEKERSNVAFMFKGGIAEGHGVVDEIVSTSDYSIAMRTLAGIKESNKEMLGNLPKVFGGKKEREWTLTESIHPKDYYQAAIFAKNETFFFVNEYPVENDGRFKLDSYKYWLQDTEGNEIINEEISKKYLDIILNHIAPILIYE